MVKARAQATNTVHQQASQQNQTWVDQSRGGMKAEFKEELREQLEVQKRQSEEQIAQLILQMRDILAVLGAGSEGG